MFVSTQLSLVHTWEECYHTSVFGAPPADTKPERNKTKCPALFKCPCLFDGRVNKHIGVDGKPCSFRFRVHDARPESTLPATANGCRSAWPAKGNWKQRGSVLPHARPMQEMLCPSGRHLRKQAEQLETDTGADTSRPGTRRTIRERTSAGRRSASGAGVPRSSTPKACITTTHTKDGRPQTARWPAGKGWGTRSKNTTATE